MSHWASGQCFARSRIFACTNCDFLNCDAFYFHSLNEMGAVIARPSVYDLTE